MRILTTADPYIPVPPTLYGGIERIIELVVSGLSRRGHEVTLCAHPDSKVGCELVPYGIPPHIGTLRRVGELAQLGAALWSRRHDADLVLSWGRLASLLPILPIRSLPKIQFYCRDSVPWRSVKIANRIAGHSMTFSGSSESVYDQRSRQGRWGGVWRTMYYAVELEKYDFVPAVPHDAPLVFLGRLERMKGVHSAIAIARASRRRLIIAGNRVDGDDGEYFDREIAPHLDGEMIQYIGPVNDAQKNVLLGGAAATLFPIAWREAFGIVMAESLACGTPVIGFPAGSVPEVVRHGVNGFISHNVEEAVAAVHGLNTLDRASARADCEARFSDRALLDNLEAMMAEACTRVKAATRQTTT